MISDSDNKNIPDDLSDFQKAVGDVNPIKSDTVIQNKPKPSVRPKQKLADEQRVRQDMLSDHLDDLEIGDELSYHQPGVQKSVFKKLKRGQFTIENELDLHGSHSEQARGQLVNFLNSSKADGLRCLRIIHGKGLSREQGPVLKPLVASWLRQRGDVLAFCSARQNDGGTGAVYVLLKKK